MAKLRFPFILLFVLIAFLSVFLLAYGYLQLSVIRRWQAARTMERQGNNAAALEQHQTLAAYLGRFEWLKSLFAEEYSDAMVARMELLYKSGKYDQVTQLAETCVQEGIADSAAAHFWSGNALFQKANRLTDKESAILWYQRSAAQYRKALQEDGGRRWNIRYNFELLMTALEKSNKGKESEGMELLRPNKGVMERPKQKVAG